MGENKVRTRCDPGERHGDVRKIWNPLKRQLGQFGPWGGHPLARGAAIEKKGSLNDVEAQ